MKPGSPRVDYVRTRGEEALSRLRKFDADLELLTYRVGRLEDRVSLLLIVLVMLAFFFGLYVWGSWPS